MGRTGLVGGKRLILSLQGGIAERKYTRLVSSRASRVYGTASRAALSDAPRCLLGSATPTPDPAGTLFRRRGRGHRPLRPFSAPWCSPQRPTQGPCVRRPGSPPVPPRRRRGRAPDEPPADVAYARRVPAAGAAPPTSAWRVPRRAGGEGFGHRPRLGGGDPHRRAPPLGGPPLALAATCRRRQAVVGDAAGLTAAPALLGARRVHASDIFAWRGTTRSLGDNRTATVPAAELRGGALGPPGGGARADGDRQRRGGGPRRRAPRRGRC